MFMFFSILCFYLCSTLGYNGIALASPNFFAAENEYLGSFVISLAEFPGIIVSSVGMCMIGRKVSQIVMFLAAGLGLALLLFPGEKLAEQIVFGFLVRCCAMGAGCIVWMIAQESMPTKFRSFGCGFCSGVSKLVTCGCPFIVELFPENNSLIPKMVFAVALVFAGILCLFYPYESKGKDLPDFVMKEVEKVEEREELVDPNYARDY